MILHVEVYLLKKTDVCPWQVAPILLMTVRKPLHNPRKIVGQYITEGMTVLDIGCGMGYFTIPMAEMVGGSGKVIAADLQPEMLDGLRRNAAKAEVHNIITHQCKKNTLALDDWAGKIDFALIFWMLHEVPDSERLILEMRSALSDHGVLFFSEPKFGHVSADQFKESLDMITSSGFRITEYPKVTLGRTALLEKL